MPICRVEVNVFSPFTELCNHHCGFRTFLSPPQKKPHTQPNPSFCNRQSASAPCFTFFFFNIYLFTWLHWVLVAALSLLSCGTWAPASLFSAFLLRVWPPPLPGPFHLIHPDFQVSLPAHSAPLSAILCVSVCLTFQAPSKISRINPHSHRQLPLVNICPSQLMATQGENLAKP